MAEPLSKYLDWVKLKPLHYIALAATCAALLFMPRDWLTLLGLDGFVKAQHGYVGFVLVASLAFLFSHLLVWGSGQISHFSERKKWERDHLSTLQEITPQEKGLLALFVTQNKNSLTLPLNDECAASLLGKRILARGQVGNALSFPYMIQPWVWKLLQEHPDLLTGAIPYERRSGYM